MARSGGSRVLLMVLLLVAFKIHSSGVECSRLLDEPGEVSTVDSSVLKSSAAMALGTKLDAGTGPSPGGNSHIQGGKLDAGSGPSPGGNSHIQGGKLDVVAPSGPSPGGNAQKTKASIEEESKTVKPMDAPSGPSPGGNGFVVEAQKVISVGSKLPKQQPTAPSGPSKGHNGVSITSVDSLSSRLPKTPTPGSGPSPGGNSFPSNVKQQTPPSGPSPGGNGFVAESQSKAAIGSKLPKQPTPPSGPSKGHNGVSIKAVDLLSSRLPKNTPTPGSGPNPGHNSVDRMLKIPVNSGSKAAQHLRKNAGGAAIGCSSDHGIPSQLFSVDPIKFAAASSIFARS